MYTRCTRFGLPGCIGENRDSLELGEVRLGNSAEGGATPTAPKCFKKPTLEEIIAYCKERNNNVDPQRFYDFYESKGWRVGNQPMKDWKACVRTWEGRDNPPKGSKVATASKYDRED